VEVISKLVPVPACRAVKGMHIKELEAQWSRDVCDDVIHEPQSCWLRMYLCPEISSPVVTAAHNDPPRKSFFEARKRRSQSLPEPVEYLLIAQTIATPETRGTDKSCLQSFAWMPVSNACIAFSGIEFDRAIWASWHLLLGSVAWDIASHVRMVVTAPIDLRQIPCAAVKDEDVGLRTQLG
jgi:hypothetical protein